MFSQINTKLKTLDQLYTGFDKIDGTKAGDCVIDIYKNNNVYKFVLTDNDNMHTSVYMWREEIDD